MSTKIFNGYKLPKLTLDELHSFCVNLGKKIVEKRKELVKERIVELYENKIIEAALSNENIDFSTTYYWSVIEYLHDKQYEINKKLKRDPLNDFEFNVNFINSRLGKPRGL